MNKPFISAIIITKNEGKNIERCLKSISWVDEIIVVDSESTDKTAEIARKFTRQVFIQAWPGYSQQKNFALEKAKGEWVLSVDSDEVIEEKLKAEILAVLSSSPAYGGFYIPRKNFIGKRWIRFGGWYPDYTLRLFKREAGRFGKRMVHEEIIVTGNKGYLTIPILHYTYQSLQDYFQRQLQYARLAGEEMLAQGKKATIFDLIFRPAYSFFKSYLFRLGVLEGHLGLFLSILSSFYVFRKYAYTHFYEDFN